MGKIPIIASTLLVVLSMTAFARLSRAARGSILTDVAQEEAVLRNIRGTVKADSGKLIFVTDDDGKAWDVMNPEMLKGYEGQHVELNVHMYVDKGVIHVHSVKTLKNPKDNLADTESSVTKFSEEDRPVQPLVSRTGQGSVAFQSTPAKDFRF